MLFETNRETGYSHVVHTSFSFEKGEKSTIPNTNSNQKQTHMFFKFHIKVSPSVVLLPNRICGRARVGNFELEKKESYK